jgi:hypothetical protein
MAVRPMAGAQDRRHYAAGDTVKLKLVLDHRANLREVRLIFVHLRDTTAPPLVARGEPHPGSDRGADGSIGSIGSIKSRVDAEVTLPPAVVPGIYKLVRISYETAGGQLGHLEKEEGLLDAHQITFEVFNEPEETPSIVDVAFADSSDSLRE